MKKRNICAWTQLFQQPAHLHNWMKTCLSHCRNWSPVEASLAPKTSVAGLQTATLVNSWYVIGWNRAKYFSSTNANINIKSSTQKKILKKNSYQHTVNIKLNNLWNYSDPCVKIFTDMLLTPPIGKHLQHSHRQEAGNSKILIRIR